MWSFLSKATRGYRLQPWRSPYLRWRIETYWGLDSREITGPDFFRFVWLRRRDLLRFLKWAQRMQR